MLSFLHICMWKTIMNWSLFIRLFAVPITASVNEPSTVPRRNTGAMHTYDRLTATAPKWGPPSAVSLSNVNHCTSWDWSSSAPTRDANRHLIDACVFTACAELIFQKIQSVQIEPWRGNVPCIPSSGRGCCMISLMWHFLHKSWIGRWMFNRYSVTVSLLLH